MEHEKKSKGKQKIEIKKIEKQDRTVTFFKRKAGIYKKGSEITTLCDADLCFIAFSETGKPYSYGYPSTNAVISRFLSESPQIYSHYQTLHQTPQKKGENEKAQEYNDLLNLIEKEKVRSKALKESKKAYGSSKGWWELDIDTLGKGELEELNRSFKQFKDLLQKTQDHKA